jgi:putative FmdB family regulatory protein
MPTYDYRCPNGHVSEKFFRKISDATVELSCPVCGATAERQLSAGGGLLFKGSGFYITDYGKDGKKAQTAPSGAKGESTSPDAKAAPDSKTTPDSKSATPAPAAKPESKPTAKPKSDE